MNALIFDNDNLERAKRMANALGQAGFTTSIHYQGKRYDSRGELQASGVGHFSIVLWHKSNEAAFSVESFGSAITISFSGGGTGEIQDQLSDGAASHIARVLRDSSVTDAKAAVLAFWNQEPYLAFRLLQEAKRACGGNAATDRAGIRIHAPMTLEDWLKPFGSDDAKGLLEVARLIVETGKGASMEWVKNRMSKPEALKAAVSEYLSIFSPPGSED
jgi:hypothetical protein